MKEYVIIQIQLTLHFQSGTTTLATLASLLLTSVRRFALDAHLHHLVTRIRNWQQVMETGAFLGSLDGPIDALNLVVLLHPATSRGGDQAGMPTPQGHRLPPSYQGGGT